MEAGLIEVVAPSPSYYPDMDKLKLTLNDPPERVRWRSKQNLDFAFLMSYAQSKGTFYVQLEDDVLAKPYYITEMKKFAIEKIARKEPWFVLDFCQLGFIGEFDSAEKIARVGLLRRKSRYSSWFVCFLGMCVRAWRLGV